jgi:hypothetical protein
MSKRADDTWGTVWSAENEMDARIALSHLAASVWDKWTRAFNAEKYPNMVGLGQVYDIWNMMYNDMKALYTLEKLLNNTYGTAIIEKQEAEDDRPGEE